MKLKFLIYFLVASNFFMAFAQSGCISGDDPDASALACVLSNVISIIFGVVGLVFAAMLAYGAMKLAMSFGDPKGLAGAQLHWQYALIGLGIIVGIMAIFSIVSNILGLGGFNPFNMAGVLQGQIQGLIQFAIHGTGGGP